ncbi:PcfB family protein [Ruthenibacterium lactatiformans]|uniref:PcfB family protein n=1 Tax=Ruthenibacterium lactatiformans TaxID=1550024 RepID=UPI0006788468|nr:PcfB family protein [Ruthenibacterium lactatiformans]
MNMGGDAAERLVRDSLMITEEAVKLAGLGAKNLAAILVALAKEEEKTHGPTHLTRLLRSGEELKLLPIKSEDLRQFRQLAKEYGVLFCPIKNKSLDNGLNDILFPASAAASVNRVLEHLGYPVPREKAVEVKKEAARGRSGSASQTRGHGSDSNARTTATERPSVRAAIDRLQKQARTQTDNAVRTVTRDEPYFEL